MTPGRSERLEDLKPPLIATAIEGGFSPFVCLLCLGSNGCMVLCEFVVDPSSNTLVAC